MEIKEVYILGGSRTPMGSYGGNLSSFSATDLGIVATKDVLQKTGIQAELIESIIMGNVLSAGLGQAPARQVSMGAGLPTSTCATTVNKVCASGMKAIQILSNDIRLGETALGIAGGMESMSSVPHYIEKARFGIGYGDGKLIDGLLKDGLTDAYSHQPMGVSGDLTAKKYSISRQEQDDYSEQSYRKAQLATDKNYFKEEIVPISVPQKKGDPIIIQEDEAFRKANFEKMRTLKPVFSKDGTVTAANASPLSDGASALILAGDSFIKAHSLHPLFKIVGYAEAEQDPDYFTTTPVLAAKRLLKKTGIKLNEIDFFEVNEAFAVVPMVFIKELEIPLEKVNVYGGAIALGHPLGNSGSRIVITLMNVLHLHKKRFGMAAICNGGGGASAILIERL